MQVTAARPDRSVGTQRLSQDPIDGECNDVARFSALIHTSGPGVIAVDRHGAIPTHRVHGEHATQHTVRVIGPDHGAHRHQIALEVGVEAIEVDPEVGGDRRAGRLGCRRGRCSYGARGRRRKRPSMGGRWCRCRGHHRAGRSWRPRWRPRDSGRRRVGRRAGCGSRSGSRAGGIQFNVQERAHDCPGRRIRAGGRGDDPIHCERNGVARLGSLVRGGAAIITIDSHQAILPLCSHRPDAAVDAIRVVCPHNRSQRQGHSVVKGSCSIQIDPLVGGNDAAGESGRRRGSRGGTLNHNDAIKQAAEDRPSQENYICLTGIELYRHAGRRVGRPEPDGAQGERAGRRGIDEAAAGGVAYVACDIVPCLGELNRQ